MPTVPVLSSKPQAPVSMAEKSLPAVQNTANEAETRQEFSRALRQEMEEKGTVSVSFLDHFASSHLHPQQPDTPAAWDYQALRYSALKQQTQQQQAQQQEELIKDASLTKQIATLTPDKASLQAYLDVQLPAYQTRLERSGLSAQQAQKAVAQLRAESVEKHILRSLITQDWQTAQQVLSGQGDNLTPPIRQHLAEQIRQVYVQTQAKELWQQALSEKPREAYAEAVSRLQEPDADLHEEIRQEITRLSEQHHRQEALNRAHLFDQLSQADASQLTQLLNTQTVLDGTPLLTARQAAQTSSVTPSAAQQAWFVKNYFNTQLDADKALEKGWCSAKDYFRLQAVQNGRLGGKDTSEEDWLCRGIRLWMNKQGFTEKDITQASYAVLAGAQEKTARINIWKQIKTLLTC